MSSEGDRAAQGRRGRPPLREQSYGGVVVRGHEVVTIVPRGKRALALPKGGPEPDERPEETAAREVREETGLTATVRAPLGDVTYWYRRSGRRIHKTVSFFLLDYVEGSTDDHDHEVTEARWVPLDEARSALTYAGERTMIEKAIRVLEAADQ
ncbi:MAG: NUDIX hydrolase [Solirubrobacteraceae bacterium]